MNRFVLIMVLLCVTMSGCSAPEHPRKQSGQSFVEVMADFKRPGDWWADMIAAYDSASDLEKICYRELVVSRALATDNHIEAYRLCLVIDRGLWMNKYPEIQPKVERVMSHVNALWAADKRDKSRLIILEMDGALRIGVDPLGGDQSDGVRRVSVRPQYRQ